MVVLFLLIVVGGVKEINAQDFICGNLKYFIISDVDNTVGVWGHIDGISAIGEVVIPETVASYSGEIYSVTSIRKYAFYACSGLTSITIPNSVASIGESAFRGCSGLTSIAIPSVTSIEGVTFSGCSSLTSVTIPNSVTSIGFGAFSYCSGLTSVTIPDSVTSIGPDAFRGCSGLTSITIPNTVTSIEENAFRGCSGLTSVTIPNTVTSIGLCTFSGCSGLERISVEMGNLVFDSRDNCNAIIETKESRLISGCKKTVIPNTVTSIGESAFRGCSGLTSITIPNTVTSIGESAFRGCSGLTSIAIPSVTSIGLSTFSGCSGLTSLTIPNSVASIGEYAFYACSGLISITIPNSVALIGQMAFSGCKGLTSLVFEGCVGFIELGAFKDCKNIASITCFSDPSGIDDDAGWVFFDIPVDIPVYVTCGNRACFQHANGWSGFTNYVEFSDDFDLTLEAEAPAHCEIVIDQRPSCVTGETTVRAIPGPGYSFVAWFENGIAISTNPVYTFCLNSNKRLVAKVQHGNGTDEYQTVDLAAYPNPSQGQITVKGRGLLKVANLLGQVIVMKEIEDQETLELPRGVYLLMLGGATQKIVVEY